MFPLLVATIRCMLLIDAKYAIDSAHRCQVCYLLWNSCMCVCRAFCCVSAYEARRYSMVYLCFRRGLVIDGMGSPRHQLSAYDGSCRIEIYLKFYRVHVEEDLQRVFVYARCACSR